MLSIKVHTEGLDKLKDVLHQRAKDAEFIVALQAKEDTSPYVPMDSGSLDMRTAVVENRIVYGGPYARYLYFGKLMVDPDTGSSYAPKGSTKVVTSKDLVFRQDVHGQAQSHWFEASKAQNLEKWVRVAAKAVANGH